MLRGSILALQTRPSGCVGQLQQRLRTLATDWVTGTNLDPAGLGLGEETAPVPLLHTPANLALALCAVIATEAVSLSDPEV